jgi:type I restriction enzyme S subunit
MEFTTYTLGEVCSRLSSGKSIKAAEIFPAGKYPVYGGNGLRGYADRSNFEGECAIIGRQGAYCGNVRYFKGEAYMTDHAVVCQANEKADTYYLSALLSTLHLERLSGQSAQPGLAVGTLSVQEINLPSLETQRSIASILSSLDRKIELNNKINADLEEMAQAIFKNWFVDFEPFKDGKFMDSELGMIPEGWKVGRLTEIASYMNGLAMQKFPPENNEDSLPVLKIKELGQGFCGTDSDRCSCNIKDECKIHNGDVIFSWSGTLLVDVWCGGDCGLNQHLFKVTSKEYPKWFYYYWTKHHLQEFIHIAKDKAVTMGHIKRGHLEEAMVAIPDNDSMEKAHELFEPILSKMISLRLESSRLSLLRDTLLPRLMSGELEVPE